MSEEFTTPFHQLLRVTRKQLGLTQEEMGKRLGVSGNWISLLETGNEDKARPSEQLILALQRMPLDPSSRYQMPESSMVREDPPAYRTGPRMIPVLGWAHAGDAASYEEIPASWQDRVTTECRDSKAFAVRIEGNSMAETYLPGDVLILSPSNEVYSGCLAVIKLRQDGFIFRQVERRAGHFKLIPLNTQWGIEELSLHEVEWAFPVFGMYRQVWKG